MKAAVEVEKPKFTPITVTIVLETVEEARLMYHLANSGTLRDSLKDRNHYSANTFDMSLPMAKHLQGTNLWRSLDNVFKERGIDV